MSDDALALTIPRTKDAPREARARVRELAGPRAEERGSTRVWFELDLDRPCPTPTE